MRIRVHMVNHAEVQSNCEPQLKDHSDLLVVWRVGSMAPR